MGGSGSYRKIILILVIMGMICEIAMAQGQSEPQEITFQHAGNITGVNDYSWALAAGDIDGDSYPDFVVGDSSASGGGQIRIFLNDEGTGHFIEHETPILTDKRPACLALADMNGDNLLDIIFVEKTTVGAGYPDVLVIYARGSPLSYPVQTVAAKPSGWIYGIATGDHGQDGDIDIFIGNQVGYIYLIENEGHEAFKARLVGIDVGRNAYGLDTGDMDRDGFLDLVIGDSDGEVEVFYGSSSGSYSRREYAPIGMLNPLPLGVRGYRNRLIGYNAFGIGVAD
ncbi:MAG: FG-GAP repeat domain-containing protein, partial [Candidatus Hodarchaeota archaeon]